MARPRTSRFPKGPRRAPLRYVSPEEQKLSGYGRDVCNLLVGMALKQDVRDLTAKLQAKAERLQRQGISKERIEATIRKAEDDMAPHLKKLTGIDVRRQPRLLENPTKIPLTKNKFALVDPKDHDKLSKYSWYCGFRGYAMRSKIMPDGSRKTVSMHRESLGAKSNEEVDHINGNRLDNRRSNLRVIDRSANLHNRGAYGPSGVKGVSWDKRKKAWRAEIGKNGKRAWLGYHPTKQSAEVAYRKASKKLYTGKQSAAR